MKKEQLDVSEIRKKSQLGRMRVGLRSEVLKQGQSYCVQTRFMEFHHGAGICLQRQSHRIDRHK